MTTTFVTAFLDLREDRSKDKSFDRCFSLFDTLASSGISIHLFLSKSFKTLYKGYPNVFVTWIELEDLDTYKVIQETPLTLPPIRTDHHDTKNFMILMNSKIECVKRAVDIAHWNSFQYAWIDFSICHVFHQTPDSLEYLKLLGQIRLRDQEHLYFPGCWDKGTNWSSLFQQVNWRFCGGFFMGSIQAMLSMYERFMGNVKGILTNKGVLPWEVNLWSYMENECGWTVNWFKANHNDSIIRVPTHAFSCVASLTTIPPRFETSCRLAIDSLLHQVDKVFLSVSKTYPRFPSYSGELPSYLSEEPYASRVNVVRPENDYGPASKYLGCLSEIPDGSLLFFCDDDQEYHPTLIEQMLIGVSKLGVYQNHYTEILRKTSGGMIHGYVGNLVPKSLLHKLSQFPLPACSKFVDDQWMSIFCFRENIPIYSSGVNLYKDIFKVLEGWHEKLGVESLSALNNRDEKVKELANYFRVRFLSQGLIESA